MRHIHGLIALTLTTIAVRLFSWATWHLVRSFNPQQERRKVPRNIQSAPQTTEHRIIH